MTLFRCVASKRLTGPTMQDQEWHDNGTIKTLRLSFQLEIENLLRIFENNRVFLDLPVAHLLEKTEVRERQFHCLYGKKSLV